MYRIALLTCLLLAPLASAGSVPVVGFLADGEEGPAGDGVINSEYPDSNESMARLITLDAGQGPTTVFVASEHAGTHLKGPLFAGLWADSLAGQDGVLVASVLLDGELVSSAEVDVAFDPESLPDPEQLVPPDPTDPEGAVMHAVGQAMPYIFQAPLVMDLGYVDVEVPNGSQVSIALSLQMPSGGVPSGVATTMKYDGVLTPSFLYLPYWSADPEAVAPQLPPPSTEPADPDPEPSGDGGAGGGAPTDIEPDGEDSPGAGVILAGAALLAVAVVRLRRR